MPTNKQRREAARRHLERQLQRREERAARRRKVTLITSVSMTVVLIAAIVITVVALSGGSSGKSSAAKSSLPSASLPSASLSTTPSVSPSSSPTTAAATYPCTWSTDTTSVTTKKVKLPPTKPPKTGKVTVSVNTTQGKMTFTLNRQGVPCTVESFVSLVQQGYYDKTPCHRLTTAGIYVLQCGDPSGKGTGGPGYSIPDEATGKETYPAGTIAMARSQAAHSGGSQFFIVYKDSPNLVQGLGTLQYTVFGKVTTGLSVVQKVAAAGSNDANGTGDGAPKLPITISSMTVAK